MEIFPKKTSFRNVGPWKFFPSPPPNSAPGLRHWPGVEEDELHVETRSEHEHVALQFDVCNGAARQRVTNSNEASVLIATVELGQVKGERPHLQITAAVDYL